MTVWIATLTTLLGLIAAPVLQDQGGAEALVERIKEQLGEVDRALQEAADAEAVAGELEDARAAHLAVIRDIESLIKEIKYQRSQQGGGGGGPSQPRPQGGEPPPSGQPPPRESDQSGAPEPQQGDPQSGGDEEAEQEGSEEQTGGEEPKGGGPDQQMPRQEDGSDPPPPESVRYTREDTDARWGLLPPKMQERLMNLHVDDVPERYRAWMDAYIRELNRLEQGGRRP
ncbi:MAG: hypothetical protein ACYTG2_15075 [Planctomycetota bacterium]|jgi:hypothetical protein